jgi:hypothetical protein
MCKTSNKGPKDTRGWAVHRIAHLVEAGISMVREHIERREIGLYLAGSRVPIDRTFGNTATVKTMRQSGPAVQY